MTWAWLTGELTVVWQPFLLGSLVVATLASVLGYFAMRGFWRLHAVRDWERRATGAATRTARRNGSGSSVLERAVLEFETRSMRRRAAGRGHDTRQVPSSRLSCSIRS